MNQRYLDAAHAMQSGVAMMMNYKPQETEPKHLRVGINSAMVDNAAVAKLLIKKGIITEQEYNDAVTEEMELEAKRYEEAVNAHLGGNTNIKLG